MGAQNVGTRQIHELHIARDLWEGSLKVADQVLTNAAQDVKVSAAAMRNTWVRTLAV